MTATRERTVMAVTAITIAVAFATVLYLSKRRKNRSKLSTSEAELLLLEPEGEEEETEEVIRSPCCSTDLETKPQYMFKRVLADNSYSAFKHLKREEGETNDLSLKLHPYEDEITYMLENPPVLSYFNKSENYPDMDASYVWVDTQQKLEYLAELLSKEEVFAVDTEQHSIRSFLGFTALMQISTHKENFLVDTIALHDEMSILQPIFVNASICKVFHGSDNDILWLQRDFHIYIVNLFDTAKACTVLKKPKRSLAYLLENYCGVSTNKMMQREDWRIRPLSEEMFHYACVDSHYLLYIAHCLHTELKIQGHDFHRDNLYFIHEVFRLSNMACIQLYTKEFQSPPGESAAKSLISRYSNSQVGISLKDDRTREIIRCLCTWRDVMARIHDESLQYILSDNAIIDLALKVPKEAEEVYSVIEHADLNRDIPNIQSASSPSPVVIGHINDINHLLSEITNDIDNLFRRIFQRYIVQAKICPLSIYNYALLSELNVKLANLLFPIQNGNKSSVRVGKKTSRKERFVKKFSCKAPVYHNCRIYASDGRLLCYCDQRKIDWYLRRDLAKIVEHNPPGIVLLFEPKGRPEDEDNEFYIQSKKNICVGCGEKNHYLRYRIIPSCYRIHFPEHLKSHRSHDIVLLCVDCHEIAHSSAERYKNQIAVEFKIPLHVRKVVNSEENKGSTLSSSIVEEHEDVGVSPLHLRSAAMALLRHGSKMPSERFEELTQIVRSYFGGRDISTNDIKEALLVGMSPYERRKLQKKRNGRLSNRNNSFVISQSTKDIFNDGNISVSAKDNFSCVDENIASETFISPDFPSNQALNEIGVFNLVKKGVCAGKNTTNDPHDCEDKSPSEDNVVSYYSSNGISARYAKKLSLLGHGPHGRQVVDYILKEQGENGVLQFCQRWRQVFIDCIHPRYLPSGWDVMHSGRRDFGEFSIFNHSHTASNAID